MEYKYVTFTRTIMSGLRLRDEKRVSICFIIVFEEECLETSSDLMQDSNKLSVLFITLYLRQRIN